MCAHSWTGVGTAGSFGYLDLDAVAGVDVDAVSAVQQPQAAAGSAPRIWGLHKPFTLRDVVIAQN